MRTIAAIAVVSLLIELVAFNVLVSNAGPRGNVNPLLVAAVVVQAAGLKAAEWLDLRSPLGAPPDPALAKLCESGVYASSACRDPEPGRRVVFVGGLLQTFLLLVGLQAVLRRLKAT